MDARRMQLLQQIQELEFAAIDLTLFMDIHPEQKQPVADYNRITERLKQVKEEYERYYGPLMAFGESTVDRWSWTDDPWPWEL